MSRTSLAQDIIERVFAEKFAEGADRVTFTREDMFRAADDLGRRRPKNVGDIVYSLRYRQSLPDSIRAAAPTGREWAIFPGGNAVYTLRAVPFNLIEPRQGLATVRLPDATPGVISRYALSDEQALLAEIRYNRLLDVFTGLACSQLQSHLRTSITTVSDIDGTPSSSQVETDDLYVGIDEHGAHYVLPVQAKRGTDNLSVVQIWQDLRVADQKFPDLTARPIAAQFMGHGAIALFEFRESDDQITIVKERHYSLVAPDELTQEELAAYSTTAQQSL